MDKDIDFWTKPNRKALFCGASVFKVEEGSHPRPKVENLSDADSPALRSAIAKGYPIWALMVSYREGLSEPGSFIELYASEDEANSASVDYQAAKEIQPRAFLKNASTTFDAENLSGLTLISVMGMGEPPYEALLEALAGAGVKDQNYQLSTRVRSWIGPTGIAKLKQKFGQNWETVAALEYCNTHFHTSSLATLAARVQVADFVAESSYDAGYASREFQLFFSGAEQVALDAKEMRQLAGEGGGGASRRRRLANLEILMCEIETLSDAVGIISEDRIVSQAIEAAQVDNPTMPKSKRTLDEYGIALRSEEPFLSRYRRVFHKPLKRFPKF